MSLTQVLSLPEVADAFSVAFKKPTFQMTTTELRSPRRGRDLSLVGIAYDYLFRAEIGDKLIAQRERQLEQEVEPHASLTPQGHPSNGHGTNFRVVEFQHIARLGLELLKDAKDVPLKVKKQADRVFEKAQSAEITKYMATGNQLTLTERAYVCLQLAKLDQVYRAGYIHDDFEAVDPDDAKDLLALIQNTSFEAFKASECCLLNPPLKAAGLVRGADADIVLDDMLIDLKTTIDFSLTTKRLNQLYGYLVLSHLGGFAGVKGVPEIRRLGVYFARYDHLFSFAVEEVISQDVLKDFCKWFKKTLTASHMDNSPRLVSKVRTIQ